MDLSPATRLKPRVAVLIDGNSFPRSSLPEVEARAARLGEVTIRRVFGDMARHGDWAQETLFTAVHCAAAPGTRRSDMALVIAALDFVHRDLASAFVIVSDDSDFDSLVSYLREQGHRAERLVPRSGPPTECAEPPVRSKRPSQAERMVRKVRALIATSGPEGHLIQVLGVTLHAQGIDVADTSHKTWRAWLLAHPDEFDCDPRGPKARVRLKG